MQKGGDRFVLRAAFLDHQARNPQQMGDVGLAVAAPKLARVGKRRVSQGVDEPIPQRRPAESPGSWNRLRRHINHLE